MKDRLATSDDPETAALRAEIKDVEERVEEPVIRFVKY